MDPSIDKLRKKAMEIMEKQKYLPNPEILKDFELLLEDYNVHKIELELQQEELRLTNQKLEAQNQRLDDLFTHAPVSYFVLDDQQCIVQLNQRACQLLEQPHKKLVRQRFTQFVDPAYQDSFYFHWQEVLRTNLPCSLEVRFSTAIPGKGYCLLNSHSFPDPESGQMLIRISATDISAVKEADLLRDSERRYRLLFRNMVNGLLVLKPVFENHKLIDFHFFRANDAFESMTGLQARKMEGSPLLHLFPEKGRQILSMILQTFPGNENQKMEAFVLRPGLIVNIYSFVPEPDYVALIFEDVTAQVKAESERLKSEEMLKTVFKILPVGVTITNQQGDIIDCNKASEALLGIRKEEHLIRNFAGKEWKIVRTDLSHMPAEEYASVRALKENRMVENVEMGIVKQKDQISWINVSAAPIPLPDLGVAIVYTDITERVQAQEESEEKFKSIVQNSTDAITIVNPAGSVIEWNRGCELIFGIVRKTALNQKIWSLMAQVIRPGFAISKDSIFMRESILSALKTGESPWFLQTSDTEITDGTGQIKTIQSVVFPVKAARGFMLGIVSRDISQAKETERMLKIARDTAEEASSAKSRFLANISHEIRTPLNVIQGFTEILKEYPATDPRFREHLSGIEKSSRALMSLINDILDLSRIEAGKMSINPVPLNLRALVEDVQQIFSLKAKNKGLEILLEVSPCLPHLVSMDETRIRQVLFNLVSNAVKFTHKGSVSISVESSKVARKPGFTHLQISVADTGIGIEASELEAIFDPFYQKDVPGIVHQEGTGLGLAISRRFVEMMNGQIQVVSEPGKGTSFTLSLPHVQVLEYRSRKGKMRLPPKTKDISGMAAITTNEIKLLTDNIFREIAAREGSEKRAREFLQQEIWTEFDKIADILGFEEVLLFAGSLSHLGQQNDLPMLQEFGKKLQQQAEALNVIEINQMLSALEKLRN